MQVFLHIFHNAMQFKLSVTLNLNLNLVEQEGLNLAWLVEDYYLRTSGSLRSGM